jgi:hypothetical protein
VTDDAKELTMSSSLKRPPVLGRYHRPLTCAF